MNTEYNARLGTVEHMIRETGVDLSDSKPTKLWWDSYRQVFAASDSQETYKDLYGNVRHRWMSDLRLFFGSMKRKRSVKRWVGPFETLCSVPRDAIVIKRVRDDGNLIVVSNSERTCLKISQDSTLKNEVSALEKAHAYGLKNHVPSIIESNFASNKHGWVLSEIAPNRSPLRRSLFRVRGVRGYFWPTWQDWLENRILPAMNLFHEGAGINFYDGNKYLESRINKARKLKTIPSRLEQLMDLLSASKPVGETLDNALVETQLHGDLTPIHVHVSNQNWNLIDWQGSVRGYTFRDFFRDHLRNTFSRDRSVRGDRAVKGFWKWLSGELNFKNLPKRAQKDVLLFSSWHRNWLGLHKPPRLIRHYLLIWHFDTMINHAYKNGLSSDYAKRKLGLLGV